MENVLPIILALLYFGYKQYKKSVDTNKEQESAFDVNQNKEGNNLESFIGSFIGLDDEVLQKDIDRYQGKPKSVTEEEGVELEEIAIETKKEESLKNKVQIKKELNKQKQIKEQNGSDTIDFDLRQAIVYDTIFNAPYINK